jgi:YqjK-like protein
MMRSIEHYTQRREHLVRQAAHLRDELIDVGAPWSSAAQRIDSGIAALRASPYPPSAILAVAAALTIAKPKLVSSWAKWLWFGVKMLQSVHTHKQSS